MYLRRLRVRGGTCGVIPRFPPRCCISNVMSARHRQPGPQHLTTQPEKTCPSPGGGGNEKKRKTYKPYLGSHSKQIPSLAHKTLPGARAPVQTLHHQAEGLPGGFLLVRGLPGPAEVPATTELRFCKRRTSKFLSMRLVAQTERRTCSQGFH